MLTVAWQWGYIVIDDSGTIARLVTGQVLIGTVGAVVVATGLDAVTIAFWRSLIGAVFMLGWCVASGVFWKTRLTVRSLLLGVVAGVSLTLSWVAFFAGILLTSISTATLLFHIQPFLVVLIGAVIWKERVSPMQVAWLAAAFVGVALASHRGGDSPGQPDDWTLGVLILLGGALVYAVTAVAGKGLRSQRGEVTTLIQTLAGVLIFLPLVQFDQVIPAQSWGWLAMIGVLQTGVAWVLLFSAFPRASSTVIAVAAFVNPMTAILSEWLFYDRPLGLEQGIGLALIMAGSIGVKWTSIRSPCSRAAP